MKVLEAVDAGTSARSAAAQFGVGVATAVIWARRYRQNGETSARRQGGRRGSRLDAHEEFVVGLIEANADVTLDEMVEHLSKERSVAMSRAGLCKWLRSRGWTHKKRQLMLPNRTGQTC